MPAVLFIAATFNSQPRLLRRICVSMANAAQCVLCRRVGSAASQNRHTAKAQHCHQCRGGAMHPKAATLWNASIAGCRLAAASVRWVPGYFNRLVMTSRVPQQHKKGAAAVVSVDSAGGSSGSDFDIQFELNVPGGG
jgi:hypothetical protein